jgi:hypothetical protein
MARESAPQSKAKGKVKRLTRERRRLSDSLGAWKMSDREEERMFSGLKKQWKNTTLAIRTTAELAGSGKKHADVSETKRLLDRMRAEDDDQKVDELIGSLLKLKKAGKEPLVLHLKQTATGVVASGRHTSNSRRRTSL